VRRYAVGLNGPLNVLHWGKGWEPPLPAPVLVVAMAVALVATYGWFAVLARRTDHLNVERADLS
jgi:hypothetical protein